MKLYAQQKPFSWMDKFCIKDAKGDDRYFVEGELHASGHRLHIYDTNKTEVALIRNKLSGLRPRVEILQKGTVSAEILKKRSLLKTEYIINGSDWIVRGDFRTHDYVLMGGYGNAVSVKIVPLNWGDCFEFDISNTADEVKALSAVMTFDLILESVK